MTATPHPAPRDAQAPWWLLASGAFLAVVAPTLVAAHEPPSITFYNQVLAVFGWGLWIAALNWAPGSELNLTKTRTSDMPHLGFMGLIGILVINAAYAIHSSAMGDLPGGMALMGAGMTGAAAVAVACAWLSGQKSQRDTVFDLFAGALCLAGVLGMVLGLIQAFHPQWADGTFIAEPTVAGRAVGNLRQPNHLSTLLVWSTASAAWLGARKRLPTLLAIACMALFIWGIVLTASRTGMVAMVFLALWGLLDKQVPKPLRIALMGAPLMYGAFWGGMWLLAHADKNVAFAAEARLHDKSDISSSRFKIWANVIDLIKAHPWAGVGYGEFNLAWTFTPFPTRPIAFFDHTHNLPLQWAVELGVPVTVLMLLALGWAWLALVWPRGQQGLTAAGASAVIVTTAMLHSLLEYPLWYSYFLLPTAFAWGAGLAARAAIGDSNTQPASDAPVSTTSERRLTWAGACIALGAAWCAWDFQAAANIYAPREGAGPLDERIAYGQKMPWFGYQADYADVTVPEDDEPPKPPHAFRRTLHNLVDARLMIAYAKSLHAAGETDKARYVVQRLKEFHNSMEKPFLAPCAANSRKAKASEALPFQCQAPSRVYRWQELLPD